MSGDDLRVVLSRTQAWRVFSSGIRTSRRLEESGPGDDEFWKRARSAFGDWYQAYVYEQEQKQARKDRADARRRDQVNP